MSSRVLISIVGVLWAMAAVGYVCEPFILGLQEDRVMAQYVAQSKWLVHPNVPVDCSKGEYAICVDDRDSSLWVAGKLFPSSGTVSVLNCAIDGAPYHWSIGDTGSSHCMINGKHVNIKEK